MRSEVGTGQVGSVLHNMKCTQKPNPQLYTRILPPHLLHHLGDFLGRLIVLLSAFSKGETLPLILYMQLFLYFSKLFSRPGLARSRPGPGSRRCMSGLTAGVDNDVRLDMTPGTVALFARLLDDLVFHGGSGHVGSGAATGLGGSSLNSAFRTRRLRRLW